MKKKKKAEGYGSVVFRDADGNIRNIVSMRSFIDYYRILGHSEAEIQWMVDEMITNENEYQRKIKNE